MAHIGQGGMVDDWWESTPGKIAAPQILSWESGAKKMRRSFRYIRYMKTLAVVYTEKVGSRKLFQHLSRAESLRFTGNRPQIFYLIYYVKYYVTLAAVAL